VWLRERRGSEAMGVEVTDLRGGRCERVGLWW
jgi:hypothetical protein